MLERARGLRPLRHAAILVAALALAGAVVWLLADRDGSESADTELADLSPEPGPATPQDRNKTGGRPDNETDRKRERGRGREPGGRKRAARHPRDDGTKRSKPADAPGPEREKQNVKRVVENLLGGGGPDRDSSQATPSDLPPEVRALIQGGDEQGPSKPQPGLEDLLGGGSGGD